MFSYQVYEDEDLLPSVVAGLALLRLLDYDVSHVRDHLKVEKGMHLLISW